MADDGPSSVPRDCEILERQSHTPGLRVESRGRQADRLRPDRHRFPQTVHEARFSGVDRAFSAPFAGNKPELAFHRDMGLYAADILQGWLDP